MKKILVTILLTLLLIPAIVKADQEMIKTYSNSKTDVGGEIELHIPVSFGKEYNFVLTYDASILEIEEKNITISHPERNEIVNDNPRKVSNTLETKIEKEKLTIKTRMDQSEGVVTYQGIPEITLKFKAIKAGSTKINIDGGLENQFVRIPEVTITEKVCNCPDVSDKQNCLTAVEEEQEQTTPPTEKVEENDNNVTNNNEKDDSTKDSKDNNVLLYCSLGLNALLLISLIVAIILKKKSTKPVEK